MLPFLLKKLLTNIRNAHILYLRKELKHMNIKEIINSTGMKKTEFATKYNIPYRTIQDWENGNRKPPTYVLEMLERIVKEDLSERFYVIENIYDGFDFIENVVYSGSEKECIEYEQHLRKQYSDNVTKDCWTEKAIDYIKNKEKTKLFEEFKKGLSEEELKRTIEINGKKYSEAYIRFIENIGF